MIIDKELQFKDQEESSTVNVDKKIENSDSFKNWLIKPTTEITIENHQEDQNEINKNVNNDEVNNIALEENKKNLTCQKTNSQFERNDYLDDL